jgi:hypothetical protein
MCLVTYGLHPRYGVRLATLFGLNSGLNEAIKLACHLPRPYWVSSAVEAFSAHSSFGFPSGAAMSGAAVYGYIASVIRCRLAVLICVVFLLATSLVRIFSGIHFLSDILGGWILGFLLLSAFLLIAPKAEEFAAGISRPARLALFLLIAAIPILLAVPAFISLAGWQVPGAWIALAREQTGAAINPARIQFAWGAAGIISGGLFGYEFLRSRGGWNPPADRKRRAGIVLAGTISVLVINAAIPAVWAFLGIASRAPALAVFLSMACVTFWLIAGVPSLAAEAGIKEGESR